MLVLLLVLIAGGVAAWYVTEEDEDGGPDASSTAPAARSLTTGLLIARTSDGSLGSITLLVDDGRRGDLVYLPPGTLVEAPALGLVPLRETASISDHELLVSSVENLFGRRMTIVVDVLPDQLAAAVGPSAPLQVTVPHAVERRDGDRIETVFERGLTTVDADQVSDLLDLPAETDLDRLVRHQAFWDAWLEVIRKEGSRALPAESIVGGLRGQIDRVAARDVGHHILPVGTISGADDLYRVEKSELDLLVQRVMPGTPTSKERIRVQVLNGTGTPGVAEQLVGPLVDAGALVALSGNADNFGYTTSQIIYYDDVHRADARRVRQALGLGEIVKSRSRLTVVAVTVVVGTDFTSRPAGSTSTSQGARS